MRPGPDKGQSVTATTTDAGLAKDIIASTTAREQQERAQSTIDLTAARKFRGELRELQKDPVVQAVMRDLEQRGFILYVGGDKNVRSDGSLSSIRDAVKIGLGLDSKKGFLVTEPGFEYRDYSNGICTRSNHLDVRAMLQFKDRPSGLRALFKAVNDEHYLPLDVLAKVMKSSGVTVEAVRANIHSFAKDLLEGRVEKIDAFGNGDFSWLVRTRTRE